MKTVNETVSIIVPVYNAEKYIVETMEHVTAQTYRDWELLLVVDGCGDASAQVIREYQEARGDERLRLLVSQENIGAARARNKGLGEAVGRYIAYLDADDLWRPEKLEAQLAFMKEKQEGYFMKRWNRFTTMLTAIAVMLCMTACGKQANDTAPAETTEPAVTEPSQKEEEVEALPDYIQHNEVEIKYPAIIEVNEEIFAKEVYKIGYAN